MTETLNLRDLLVEDPWQGLTFELCRSMSVTRATGKLNATWAVKVYKNHATKSGKGGKRYVIGLVGKPDDSGPAELLRMLAIALEQGDVPVSGKKALAEPA